MPNKSSNSSSTPATLPPATPHPQLAPSRSLACPIAPSAGQTKTALVADPLQDQRKRELLKSLFGLGVAGLGVGAGARAGIGLHQLITSAKPDVARTSSIPETIPVPVLQPAPLDDDTLDETDEPAPLAKLAAALASEKTADLGDAAAGLVPQSLVDAIPNISNTGHPLKSWQGMPAGIAAAGGGLIGGWSLMDWLAKHRRKQQQQSEVDDARDDFRESLGQEYRTAMMAKNADQHDPLDQAFERWKQTKQANPDPQAGGGFGQQLVDWGNLAGGLYGATALGIGAGTGYATYKATKARSARKLLQKAIEARARQRSGPQPIYAVPTGDMATV